MTTMCRLIAILLLAASAIGQTSHRFPAKDTNNVFTGSNTFQALTATTVNATISLITPTATISGLSAGNCVQAGTGGLLTTVAGPCIFVLPAQYAKLRCESGLGDGLNAMSAGTYLQSFCYNSSGVTWTIVGIRCFTDNNGTSTLNVTNGTGTGLLTGAVTCTNAFASGTQSGTVTIASGDFAKFTFVSDGVSKQTTWVASFTQ